MRCAARHRPTLDFDPLSRTAIFGEAHPARQRAPVALVMAGTSDLPVGREAARTLPSPASPIRNLPISASQAFGGCSSASRISKRRRSSLSRRAWTPRWSAWSAALSAARHRPADIGRLWRGEGRRNRAACFAGELRAGHLGRQYRQWLWRRLRRVADHAGAQPRVVRDCSLRWDVVAAMDMAAVAPSQNGVDFHLFGERQEFRDTFSLG